jgi:hypothetical protein
MNHFYLGHTRPAPLDQADGLRRLFAGSGRKFLPLVANPHVAFGGIAIERLSAALALQGRHTLAPQVSYLPARGLPLRYVNTRGSSARLLDELSVAAPQADVILLHAGAADLARLFTRRAARPMLLAADHPESVKHAYASLKLLVQRCGWMSCDLLLLAPPASLRLPHIAASLGSCADSFLGAAVADWSAIDPACHAAESPTAGLQRIVAAQLQLDDDPLPAAPAAYPAALHPAPGLPVVACH